LIYSTCSYSKEEDEEIMDWATGELSMVNCQLSIDKEWNITETRTRAGNMGYRFWPDKVKGEGFFIACFRKTDGEEEAIIKIKLKAAVATKKEIEVIEKWVKGNSHDFIKYENTVYAWPKILAEDMNFLLTNLRVIYSGVRVGELIRDKLVPDHALGMSKLVNNSVNRVELDQEQAIQYLQRKDLEAGTNEKGWQLVNYKGHSLGWINVLPNRINNYYPKELRILKEKK
jgi:NOL1/NOP2/fmu family ribosome biogenesis protein